MISCFAHSLCFRLWAIGIAVQFKFWLTSTLFLLIDCLELLLLFLNHRKRNFSFLHFQNFLLLPKTHSYLDYSVWEITLWYNVENAGRISCILDSYIQFVDFHLLLDTVDALRDSSIWRKHIHNGDPTENLENVWVAEVLSKTYG